jgi:hypothetical protein
LRTLPDLVGLREKRRGKNATDSTVPNQNGEDKTTWHTVEREREPPDRPDLLRITMAKENKFAGQRNRRFISPAKHGHEHVLPELRGTHPTDPCLPISSASAVCNLLTSPYSDSLLSKFLDVPTTFIDFSRQKFGILGLKIQTEDVGKSNHW